VWLGALEPGCALLGVEPGLQLLGAVEAVDGPVLAGWGLRPEDLDAEMTGERARRGDDALELSMRTSSPIPSP
jgi:hypothetical protein